MRWREHRPAVLDVAWYTRLGFLPQAGCSHLAGCRPSAVRSQRVAPKNPERQWPDGGLVPFQSRAQRLPLVVLAIGALALGPAGTRVAAQTQTRQVSVESLIYDLKNPD